MKHYIIGKFTPEVSAPNDLIPRIREIFSSVIQIDGIHDVHILPNCVPRDNRYDVMIVIDMEASALEAYDHCESHRIWKEEFGPILEKKAIFDHE